MATASNTGSKPAAMSRGDIVSEVAAKADLPQATADQVVREYEAAIQRALVGGGEVRIAGFGTFKTKERAARTSRNPATGGTVQVAARTVLGFKPSSALKEAIAGSKGGGKGGAKGGAKAGAAAAAKGGAKSAAPAAAKGGAKSAAPVAKSDAKSSAPAAKAPAKGAAGATKAAKGGAKGGKK